MKTQACISAVPAQGGLLAGDTGVGTKHDDGKLRYDLMPPGPLQAIVEVLTYGAAKYGDHKWQTLPDAEPRYYAALMRHLEAARAGETTDPESGLPTLAHAACDAVFLLWFAQRESEHDLRLAQLARGFGVVAGSAPAEQEGVR